MFKTLLIGLLFFSLSCTTTHDRLKDLPGIPKTDLEQSIKRVSPQNLPEEKIIRRDLLVFQKVLKSGRPLTAPDWDLHDRLLNYYVWLKKGAEKPSTVIIPARSHVTQKLESYCLESGKAVPSGAEQFMWQKLDLKVPYVRELLDLAAKRQDLPQQDVQGLIWNLGNQTKWENYPKKYQEILLSIDPKAPSHLPNELKEAVKTEAMGIAREYVPDMSDLKEAVSLVQGKYYDYQQIRSAIEGLKSKHELKPKAGMVLAIPETPLFSESESHSFTLQEVTLYNPTDRDFVLDLSLYRLKPTRPDVQMLALIERNNHIDGSLLAELEQTLYDDMTRMGLGFTPVLGDLIDLYEASTGKDFFNDEWLSNENRFLSAMGVLAGSGRAYRYAKKILEGPPSYVRETQKNYRLIKNLKSYEKLKELADLAHGKNIPDDWPMKITRIFKKEDKLQGLEFIHPDNQHIRVRIMPGNPNSEFPNSRKPYVMQTANGIPVDAQGRKLPTKRSNEAHIPLEDYQFKEFWGFHGKK